MKILLKIILLSLLFFPQIITAQYKNLEFDRLTSDDGLSESTTHCILQDKEGFIWIGTWSGLNRYDGYNFKVYKNEPDKNWSISDNLIICLYEDINGVLWAGTAGGGLNKFDKTTEQFVSYKHNPYDSNSISDNRINSIFMDREGFLWVGTMDFGLNKFDEKTNRFIHYHHNPDDTNSLSVGEVWAIYEDRSGNLWIGTKNGLNRFDRKTIIFYHYKNNPNDKSSISNNQINCIYEDRAGNLWIGTDSGLNKIDYNIKENYSFKHYFFNENTVGIIYSIYEDNNGFLWIGKFGSGLFIFNTETEEFTNFRNDYNNPKSLISNLIVFNSIFEDRNGVFWIGTNRGINIYRKQKMKFNLYTNSPDSQGGLNFYNVYPAFEDKEGNLWMNSYGKFIIRDKSNTFTIIDYSSQLQRTDINIGTPFSYIDKSGVIWLRDGENLMKYNPETRTLIPFPDFTLNSTRESVINSIFEDSDSLLWIGTRTDVRVINRERTKITKFFHNENDPYSLSNGYAYNIYEDKKGAIWICMISKGLDKYDKKTGRFYHYISNSLDSNSLNSNYPLNTYDDGNGNLWINTCVGGLNKLNMNTNTFTYFTKKDGLADDCTIAMLPDDSGNLWISTNRGISKFNIQSQTFKNYDKEDGFPSNEFLGMGGALKTRKGELWFVNINGLVYFYPDSLKENTHIPPVVITSFKIFDKEAALGKSTTKIDEINLSYKENFFSFEFAALDYTNPKKNQYKYMLEGVDNEWRNSGNIRTANYTDISPGEYVFRVKGSNNDGIWNEEGASIRIIITPPWWQTWWFRTCGIILIIGFIGFAFNRRLHAVKKEKKTQEEFTRQLISAHEDERKRIAGELHDSLGQNLLIIKNKAAQTLKKKELNLEIINDISEISSSTLQEVREISYNLHPYQLERLGLTKAIESITERALKSTNIKFKDELDTIDKIFNPEIEINIYRIIQECVNNIIKHSGASEAKLVIKKKQDKVTITISDNGKGFDINTVLSDKSKRGIGLMDINERAKLFNGKVEFDSAQGKGTTCKISIPYIQNI